MYRHLIVLAALALAGCASPPLSIKNPIGNSGLANIESLYGVALSGAVAYRNRPRCTKTRLESVTNLCARRSIVVKLQDADYRAEIAIGKAETFILTNPTLDPSSLVQAAAMAVSAFNAIQSGAQ